MRIVYERLEFNKAVVAGAERRVADIMMSPFVDSLSSTLLQQTGWLTWAFNGKVKEKQIVLAKLKLALQALL